MKRATQIAFALFVIIAVGNYFYYKNLFNNQIEYISNLLDRQVQLVGQEVDEFNTFITSDLSKIDFSDDIDRFFDDQLINQRATERLKLYYIKYQDFITGISIINNRSDVFNMALDESREGFRRGVFTSEEYWLFNTFQTHDQQKIYQQEALIQEGSRYNYYQPILNSEGKVVGNFRVSVDHDKYFTALFDRFKAEQYQWQWLINDTGTILKDKLLEKLLDSDSGSEIEYHELGKIITDITDGSTGNIRHRALINGDSRTIISSYCPVSLLAGMEYGIIFSAPTDFFQTYIIRNSTSIVISTLIMVLIIIFVFRYQFGRIKLSMINSRDAEKMLDRLIEEMPVGVIIYNQGREILKSNKIAAGFYNYEMESDMTGKIFPEPHSSDESNYFSKNLGGKFSPDQFIIIRKELGEQVLFRSSIAVTYTGQQSTMEILIDVTMLESARKHEERANVAKTEFLARMSYEIRTPLNGIIGMADILSKYKLEKEASEMVGILRRSTELLLGIINDILDFSSIESGRIILDEIPFNLHQEMGFCLDLAQSRVDGKSITVKCEVGRDVPESIIGDPFRLRQVLSNLMLFAIHNTTEGEISMSCRKKALNEGVITLEFDLRDTGTGYDKAELKTIFGDFVQAEAMSLRRRNGSGLGTALARQMIEIMGGKLNASSPSGLSNDPEKPGTRILFTISVYSNERVPKNYLNGKIKSFGDLRALVITGTQNRDEDMLSILHKAGVNTVVTSYNRSTINQLKANYAVEEERYNLVFITDDEDINGFEVAGNLMNNNLHVNYAVIMISAVDLKGNYLKCINMGVDHYLVRPVEEEEIRDAITTCFPELGARSDHSESGQTGPGIEVLVVEDNKMNRVVIGKMLDTLGHTPDFAFDGDEACILAGKKNYDIIFMDLQMPVMDGYEASRQILAENKSVIIAAFTADNAPEARKKAELSGIREFLSKPVRIEHLKNILKKYFGDKEPDVE
jgi:signal transduction histidine kinase/CheY-like chemotaxis protein